VTLTGNDEWHTEDMLDMILRYTEERDLRTAAKTKETHGDNAENGKNTTKTATSSVDGVIKTLYDRDSFIGASTGVSNAHKMDFVMERQDHEIQDCIPEPSRGDSHGLCCTSPQELSVPQDMMHICISDPPGEPYMAPPEGNIECHNRKRNSNRINASCDRQTNTKMSN